MNKKILLINRYTGTSTLPDAIAKAGYSVDFSLRLESALDYHEHYDLIILIESPFADSWTSCEKIRKVTSTPLIVISINATTKTCIKAIDAGADYFIRKPYGHGELLARVNSLLQRVSYNQVLPLAF